MKATAEKTERNEERGNGRQEGTREIERKTKKGSKEEDNANDKQMNRIWWNYIAGPWVESCYTVVGAVIG